MKKYSLIKWILVLVAVIVLSFGVTKIFGSFSPTGSTVAKVPAPRNEDVQEMVVVEDTHEGVEEQTGNIKIFEIKASQWKFDPRIITVNKGDTVKLHLETRDVTHGFAIPEFGIDEKLELGKDVHAEFVADKAGTFMIYCSIPCGSDHGNMKGSLIVEE